MPRYGPWTDAALTYVGTSIPLANMTRYAGSGDTNVTDAADNPTSDIYRQGFQNLAEAGAGATTARAFTEGILLGDARTAAAGAAPGTGDLTTFSFDPVPIGIEWESDAGVWTGNARFAFDIDVSINSTGWYSDDRSFQVRLADWTTGNDSFGVSGSVLFTTGWQSAADLAAATLLKDQPLELAGFGTSREITPIRTDTAPIDLSDARLACSVCIDAQVDHVDMGSGHGISVTVIGASLDLEYQPPRYRYIFTESRLRQLPRDDALGGAPRQGRTSRSVQGSSRQGWIGTYR